MISCRWKNMRIEIEPLLWVRVQPGWMMMGLKAPLGMNTYLTMSTRRTRPVDDWALCCVADSLQYRSFAGVCSSNDEHSELDIRGAGIRSWGQRWRRRRRRQRDWSWSWRRRRRRRRDWSWGCTQTTNKLLCTHSTKVL